jgi:hypothetical protein
MLRLVIAVRAMINLASVVFCLVEVEFASVATGTVV